MIDAQTALNEEAPRIIYGRNNAAQELKAHENAMKTSALPPLHSLLLPPPPRGAVREARACGAGLRLIHTYPHLGLHLGLHISGQGPRWG